MKTGAPVFSGLPKIDSKEGKRKRFLPENLSMSVSPADLFGSPDLIADTRNQLRCFASSLANSGGKHS